MMSQDTQINRSNIYKWILLLVATAVTMIDFGLVFSFGALFATMMETFQTDRAATATVQSILMGVTLSLGAVSGAIISKIGLEITTFVASLMVPLGFCMSFFTTEVVWIYFTVGVVSGIGVSLAYISCVVAVGREFSGSQKTLCLSILNTSYVVATIVYPYCLEWLTEHYGLMGTFLILGGLTSNTFLLFAMCWINRNNSKNNKSSVSSEVANDNNIQSKQTMSPSSLRCGISNVFARSKKYMSTPYLFILVATGVLLSSLDAYLSLILDIALWKQINSSRALFSFVIFSSCAAVSSLLPGLLKQKKGIDSCIYPICSTLSGGIGVLIVYFANDHITFMFGTSFVGVAYGGILSSSMNVVVKIVELEFIPVATGLLLTVEGLIATGIGPLYGWIRDKTGTYGSVLVTILTVHGVSVVLYVLALIFRRLDRTRAKQYGVIYSSKSPEQSEKEYLMISAKSDIVDKNDILCNPKSITI